MPVNAENPKSFYDAQYQEGRYAVYSSPEAHPFHGELKDLLSRYGHIGGQWLEVGCGRGLLQDVVEDYTGVDIAETVALFMHKPFRSAPAEDLPFEDKLFDGAWSYAVLEHVDDPEKVLSEMRRVVKPGGIMFLRPAWQCRPWAGRDYAWKPFRELSLLNRIRKATIPLRDAVLVRAISVLPLRLFRLGGYVLRRKPTRLRYRHLNPNYSEYRVVDADARHHIDPFEVILWFSSRGNIVHSHPGWFSNLFVRTGTVVVEVVNS